MFLIVKLSVKTVFFQLFPKICLISNKLKQKIKIRQLFNCGKFCPNSHNYFLLYYSYWN